VGGSLTDGRKEGERFLQLARFVKQANTRRIPVALGSGAIPDDLIDNSTPSNWCSTFAQSRDVVEPLFAKLPRQEPLCRYHRWIEALETAVPTGDAATSTRNGGRASSSNRHSLEWQGEHRRRGPLKTSGFGIIPSYC